MTVAEVKQYLRQLKTLDNLIQAKLDKIEELSSLATRITQVPQLIKVQESTSEDKLSEIVIKIVELENELKNMVDKLFELKTEIIQKIDNLDHQLYKLILTMRYINFMTWEKIAVELGCSYQWVHVLHSRALIYFTKKVQEDELTDWRRIIK